MTLKEYFDAMPAETPAPKIALARAVGVSPAMISHLIERRRNPSSSLARRIEIATGGAVTLADWYPEITLGDHLSEITPEERAHG